MLDIDNKMIFIENSQLLIIQNKNICRDFDYNYN